MSSIPTEFAWNKPITAFAVRSFSWPGAPTICVEVCRDADTLVIESTYLDEEAQMATQFAHLTARRAAELAVKAGVKHLILTHLSRRYRERDVIAEARSVFPGAIVARDFDNYQVRRWELVKVELKEPEE